MATMSLQSLLNQIDLVTAKKKSYADDSQNYWRQTKDKAGNAASVIRLLPNKEITDVPFVRIYGHAFKNPDTNRWYIENSLSTLGEQDHVGITNSELWNSGLEENKELARTRKRKLSFISNILVIKDPGNPENEGKVMLWKYGQKIFSKIIDAAKPDDSLGETPVNVFDPLEGADFSLRQTVVAGFPNYDGSKFGSMKPIAKSQKDIDAILSQCFDINLEVAPDKFKSAEELKKKFMWVTGEEDTIKQEKRYDEELDELTKIANAPTPPAAKTTKPKGPPLVDTAVAEDDDAKFFASLIND